MSKIGSSIRRSLGSGGSGPASSPTATVVAGGDIKSCWQAFMDANEVLDAVSAYKALRSACGVPDDANGRTAFDRTLQAVVGSNVPHKNKSLIQALADNWKLRPPPKTAAPMRVVISGAGPVGLRAAVEAALNGLSVHVLEKRDVFSRVNILMLWQQTADDMVAYGARSFYPKFTNRNIGNSPLHLGTREIQLVLLKNALLLGVSFSYGSELVAVQAPAAGGGGTWLAIARTAASTATHQTAGGVLDFKPNKMGDYTSGVGQGKCNMLQTSELDTSFALAGSEALPAGVAALPFDALLLAEGEWSPTCKRLGVTKSIDRFTTAIGLVINMVIDPNEPATKDPNMRSFTISPLDDVGRALKAAKLDFEFGEYLKGETHYIVLTIKKATLLAHGVLREDLPGANLLTKTNLDEPKLMDLSRRVATIIGLPESVAFTDFHPAKLFDFSTRARCLAPFRILAVRSGGARAGQVVGMDLEAQPFLKDSESKWYDRALEEAEAEVAKRHTERAELEKAISDVSATLQQSMEAAADTMIDKVGKMVQGRAMAGQDTRAMTAAERANKGNESDDSGVHSDEWEDSDDEERRKLSEQIQKQKAENARLMRSQITQARLDRQAIEQAQAAQAAAAAAGGADYDPDEKRKLTPEEERQMQEAQLELYQRALKELEEKTRVQQGNVDACRQRREEWLEKVAETEGGVEAKVPVFPIGDAVLEPFWPQGLGSNRGFHSAMDAVWAVHVMREEGLDAALLERNFWYDLMLQGPWKPGLLKQSKGWSADPVSRYVDGATVRSKAQYTNTQSKRLFRGEGAVPPRIEALGLKAERGIGGAAAWS